jgi:hypothetical protein
MHNREHALCTVQAMNSKSQGLEKKEEKRLVHSSVQALSTTTTFLSKNKKLVQGKLRSKPDHKSYRHRGIT